MKRTFAIALYCFTGCLLAGSCKSTRLPTDSSKVVETVRYIEKEVLRDTTVYITLPAEIKYRETRDTLSELETSIAKSTAMVSGGVLTHLLENKNDYRPEVEIIYKDRVVFRDTTIYKEQKTPYPVEKELSWWQNFRMTIGGWLLAVVAGGIAFFVAKKLIFK